MYKVGMYGGSFDPLHIGHLNNILKASSMCKKLYIVLSYSKKRDNIPIELRYRWIYNLIKHIGNTKILLLEDDANSKDDYNNSDKYWIDGAQKIKYMINKTIDVVFCGDDYKGKDLYESLYGNTAEIIYFSRNEVSISSTQIRENPFKYWDYIPQICRPYYVKKILLIGGESTGKSTLTQNLALTYNTNFLEEVGRDICEFAGGEDTMIAKDLQEILIKHKAKELDVIKNSNKLLFVDTEALITKFYSQFLLKDNFDIEKCESLADAINAINDFDLVLFLDTDIQFVQDGTRSEEIASDRVKYSNMIKDLFNEKGIHYQVISGNYLERFNKSKELINKRYFL